MTASWDAGLAKLTLGGVNVQANSLVEAWKEVSTAHLVRSVLVASGRPVEERPFAFEAAKCSVRTLYDALADAYGLAWEQDERTGVACLHPAALAYGRILGTTVHVAHDYHGLPMHTGILEPLGSGVTGMTVKPWGSAFRNTFDFAVDVPAGSYAVRDLLNLCCVANPTKTFFARAEPDGFFVTAVNLVCDDARAVPAGALRFWEVAVGTDEGPPSYRRVRAALAHRAGDTRRAARGFVEAVLRTVPVETWVSEETPTPEALWACIGVTSVLVRCEEATHRASIETMRRRATGGFLTAGETGLAVMTALDLTRLTKDPWTLNVVLGRRFEPADLAGVASDACRIAALSGYVRNMLRAERATALLDASPPLAAAVQSPTPGRLAFERAL